MGKTKLIPLKDSKICIVGDNVLFINGIAVAYYIVPLTNYSVTSGDGALYDIQGITNILTGLSSSRADLAFSLQRFSKTIRKKDVLANLYETIRIYEPDYDMPAAFTKNIGDNEQEFCLLGVSLPLKDAVNVEDESIATTAKNIVKDIANSLFGNTTVLNEDKILTTEHNIFSVLRTKFARATKEMVFYNYVSKLYPCYNISYDKLSYINEYNFSNILGVVNQTVEDNFGYFVMHNEGVDFFDLEPQDTFGCILSIAKFPLQIPSENFPLNFDGMQINIKTIPKEKATLQLKRTRANDTGELDEALKAGAEIEQLEATVNAIDIATHAITEVEEGVQMCEFSANILITGLTREDLRQNIQYVVTALKDRDMLPAKSLTQAIDFIDHYVKIYPKKFDHFTNLQYPLSFQLNSGSLVGDSDGKFFVPSIGEDLM